MVSEARDILDTLDSSRSRLVRLDKRSGFVGNVAYYAKEVFFILFRNSPTEAEPENPSSSWSIQKLSKPLASAVRMLEVAARAKNPDAIYLLAQLNFYGNYSYPRNYSEAFRRYLQMASLTGNSSAQSMVGFMYGTGVGGAVERDQAKALLYHTFAALGGDIRSEMTVAFRHHTGIGTPRNCDKAVSFYKKVADKAIQYWRSGPPGGQSLIRHSYRIADEEGGVYGEGASVSSSGVNANNRDPRSDSHAALDDVLDYLDLLSRKGDLKATLNLGRLHFDGSRVLKRDIHTANRYFLAVSRKYWNRDGKPVAGTSKLTERLASKAAGYLGRIHLRGEGGIIQDFERAKTWFRRGIQNVSSSVYVLYFWR